MAIEMSWVKAQINVLKTSEETFTDAQMELCVYETEQWIKNYCKIPDVPNPLKYVLVNMALDLLRTQFPTTTGSGPTPGTDPTVGGMVKEITEGDTTVTFDTSAEVKGGYTHAPEMDELFFNYLGQLQQFRRGL